jgi:ribonuclease E
VAAVTATTDLATADPETAATDPGAAPQSLPEDTGPWGGQDEPVAEQHSATDADGAELESDVDVPVHDAASTPSDGEPSAPRPRRRRGRVVAPAGPPPTTSTGA